MDDEYREAYKRQMEIYQWLLRNNGHKVSDTGYFVYANGKRDKEAFDSKLEFDVEIMPYKGNDSWVERAIKEAHECMMEDEIPEQHPDCNYCNYRKTAQRLEK